MKLRKVLLEVLVFAAGYQGWERDTIIVCIHDHSLYTLGTNLHLAMATPGNA